MANRSKDGAETMDASPVLCPAAAKLGRTRRIKRGDEVEIVRILERPTPSTPLAQEELYRLLTGRAAIIAACPGTRIKIKGRLTGKIVRDLWQITVPSATQGSVAGIFSRPEFISL